MKASAAALSSNSQRDFFAPEPASPAVQAPSTPLFAGIRSGEEEHIARAARIAGRLNASTVSDEERDALYAERQSLLDKKFAEAMTRKEEIRLTYVQWSLDRIEEALHSQTLDELEKQISRFERLGSDVNRLVGDLRRKSGRR
jgi:hypothetical protein